MTPTQERDNALRLLQRLRDTFKGEYCPECKCMGGHETAPRRCSVYDLLQAVDVALHHTCPTCRGEGRVLVHEERNAE